MSASTTEVTELVSTTSNGSCSGLNGVNTRNKTVNGFHNGTNGTTNIGTRECVLRRASVITTVEDTATATVLTVDNVETTETDNGTRQLNSESLSDWLVLLCAFLTNVINGISFTSYGILYMQMTEQFESSRAAVGWIQSLESSISCIFGIFFSHPINLYGCRLISVIGSVLVVAGKMLSCLSPNLFWMYILMSIIPGVGQAMCMLATSVVIQQRFNKHRSLATGIAFVGFSVGNFTGPPLIEFLLNTYGLRGTVALIGAIHAQRLPLALNMRTPTHLLAASSPSKKVDTASPSTVNKFKSYLRSSLDFKLMTKKTFAIFCAVGVLIKFTTNGFLPHTVNWAVAAGLRRSLAVIAVSTVSFTTLFFRMSVAYIADKKWTNRLLVFTFGVFLGSLSAVPQLLFPGHAGTFISVILFGAHIGCAFTLIHVVMVDLQGVEQIARCVALFNFLSGIAILAGSPFMGWMFDMLHSYTAAFGVLCLIDLTATGLSLTVYILQRRKLSKTKTPENKTDETSKSLT